ncbi:galactosylceramide sulfotransferase [Dendropsophus ebraccatus]|uniref:galactosylceramide sulfotransferase n=1 Tax=Dendropsophus ebraccatus TaxID=150705 RepID=UPI003831D3A7
MTCIQIQSKLCRSLWKGFVLGTLLTTFLILLYSYAAPPLSFTNTEDSSSFQCHPSSLPASQLPKYNSTKNLELHCFPRHNLMFLKTHKTGSSTILNILFRYGEKHQLRFAFPNGRNDFDYPHYFQRWQVKGYHPGLCYNIICNHMRYRHSEVNLLIPPDTVFLTVLRNPALLFESSFQYFLHLIPLTWKLPGDESEQKMDSFLHNPMNYYDSSGFNAQYLHNLMTFDLGYDNEMDIEDPRVSNILKQLDSRFHLVMLLEYFDESLLLLRDYLCWDMDDVLYFKLNARKDSRGSRLSPEIYRLALEWNALDTLIYKHFNATFWRKVKQYGVDRMKNDVIELRRRNEELKQECIAGGGPVDASKIQESWLQPWQPVGRTLIQGYNLRKNISSKHKQLCRDMLTPEIQYMGRLGADLWVTRLWGNIRALLNL